MGWMCHIKTIKKHLLTMAQSMAHTGFIRVAGKLPGCLFLAFFFPPATGKHGWDGVVASLNTMPGTSWCYIANRVELGGSVMYNVVKTQKKQCPSHHHFYTVGFYGYHQKPGWCIFVLHTHISHLHLSTRNDLRRLWRLKKHCRL